MNNVILVALGIATGLAGFSLIALQLEVRRNRKVQTEVNSALFKMHELQIKVDQSTAKTLTSINERIATLEYGMHLLLTDKETK